MLTAQPRETPPHTLPPALPRPFPSGHCGDLRVSHWSVTLLTADFPPWTGEQERSRFGHCRPPSTWAGPGMRRGGHWIQIR